MSGLSDSKYTAKDCDVMLGITNPFSYELPEYLQYNIQMFKGNFRCLEIVLNRSGQSNGICPLFFDGAINFFGELPLPNDKANLEKVYKKLEKIRNTKIVSNTKSFLSYSLSKKQKELHNKTILSKFAALFNKIIKKY